MRFSSESNMNLLTFVVKGCDKVDMIENVSIKKKYRMAVCCPGFTSVKLLHYFEK